MALKCRKSLPNKRSQTTPTLHKRTFTNHTPGMATLDEFNLILVNI